MCSARCSCNLCCQRERMTIMMTMTIIYEDGNVSKEFLFFTVLPLSFVENEWKRGSRVVAGVYIYVNVSENMSRDFTGHSLCCRSWRDHEGHVRASSAGQLPDCHSCAHEVGDQGVSSRRSPQAQLLVSHWMIFLLFF